MRVKIRSDMDPRDLFLSPTLTAEEAARYLGNSGFLDAARADENLQAISALGAVRGKLAQVAPRLIRALSEAADPDFALLQLRAFFEAVPSPDNLASWLSDNEAALQVLAQVLGASPHLAATLIRNPEYFYWMTAGLRLSSEPSEEALQRDAGSALDFESEQSALDALRRFRRRESLRIATQDLLGLADFRSIVRQISTLADVILQTTLQILTREFPTPPRFVVVALGKLGGSELNFSSDIDVIYVFAEEGDRPSMTRLARRLTQALSEPSGEGRLYRVDLRLRPGGRAGEIAHSLQAYRYYYETAADTFDRLALIKCRPVAGDPETRLRFAEMAEEFVYRKYLDHAAIDEIRWLKRRTEREMEKKGEESRNIKLGTGGIREIEFFVQSMQILYGGQEPSLRSPNTLKMLAQLVDAGFITMNEFASLENAYIFLRELEHRLQLVHDQQTQLLPVDPQERLVLARRMGYVDRSGEPMGELRAFQKVLDHHNHQVRTIFESLFSEPAAGGLQELALNPSIPEQEAIQRLREAGLQDPAAAWSGLQQLFQVPAFPHTPSKVRNLLANLLTPLLKATEWGENPSRAVVNFDRFCERLGSRAEMYRTLLEDQVLAESLFRILASGDFLAETLIRQPELLDSVARIQEIPVALPSMAGARQDRENLRLFKQREEFKTALLQIGGQAEETSRRRLSDLASTCLLETVRQLLEHRDTVSTTPFALLALGKLGGHELTYFSDLDLVLVYDDSICSDQAGFNHLVSDLKRSVEEYGQVGPIYQLDFRLRPEGRRSSPATPLSVFNDYFSRRAEPWERLAYVKLRPVFINAGLSLEPPSFQRPFSTSEMAQLRHVRRRKEEELARESSLGEYDFKNGIGALLDIQFVVQLLQIQHDLQQHNLWEALRQLSSIGLLPTDHAAVLKGAVEFYSRLESARRLLTGSSATRIPALPEALEATARWAGCVSGKQLLAEYRETSKAVRDVYSSVFGPES